MEAAKAVSAPIAVQIKRRLVRAQVAIAHFLLHHCIVFAASPTVRGEDAPAGPRCRDHLSPWPCSCRMCYKCVPLFTGMQACGVPRGKEPSNGHTRRRSGVQYRCGKVNKGRVRAALLFPFAACWPRPSYLVCISQDLAL